MPGVGDTRYVPWAEGGNGGTINQVMVFEDWEEELDPGDWWVVWHGSNGQAWKNGKKGKKRKREKEGGNFLVAGELLSRTQQEAEIDLREALEERDDGDDGHDEGDGGDNKGEGGEEGGDKGGEKEGDTGGENGGAGSKDEPGNLPPHKKASLCVATRERGAGGLEG